MVTVSGAFRASVFRKCSFICCLPSMALLSVSVCSRFLPNVRKNLPDRTVSHRPARLKSHTQSMTHTNTMTIKSATLIFFIRCVTKIWQNVVNHIPRAPQEVPYAESTTAFPLLIRMVIIHTRDGQLDECRKLHCRGQLGQES